MRDHRVTRPRTLSAVIDAGELGGALVKHFEAEGLMSGDGKPGECRTAKATAPVLDTTGRSQSAGGEGPVLTEIGKPMLGTESGKNLPARMAGCSSSKDWPPAYA
jgi:hypothetical protein